MGLGMIRFVICESSFFLMVESKEFEDGEVKAKIRSLNCEILILRTQ